MSLLSSSQKLSVVCCCWLSVVGCWLVLVLMFVVFACRVCLSCLFVLFVLFVLLCVLYLGVACFVCCLVFFVVSCCFELFRVASCCFVVCVFCVFLCVFCVVFVIVFVCLCCLRFTAWRALAKVIKCWCCTLNVFYVLFAVFMRSAYLHDSINESHQQFLSRAGQLERPPRIHSKERAGSSQQQQEVSTAKQDGQPRADKKHDKAALSNSGAAHRPHADKI